MERYHAPPGGTSPSGINPAGAITGYYNDAGFLDHGFLRARDGTFTEFDAPGAVSTTPSSINPAGAITGSYWDASGVHGFLRIGTEISLSATSLTFPAQNVGTTIARVIVVTNHGSVPVSVTSVAATGDFRATRLCARRFRPMAGARRTSCSNLPKPACARAC